MRWRNGIMREEVWVNGEGEVMRYNLAFLMPHKTSVDHERILGYDNAHGVHERHLMGEVLPVPYDDYPARAEQFYLEVEALRRQYEDKNIC